MSRSPDPNAEPNAAPNAAPTAGPHGAVDPRLARHLPRLLDFALDLAVDAGRATLGHFQSGLRPEFKADASPVTEADREAEELMRGRIEAAFPDHGVLGEEFGEANPGAEWRWILDPIDGTKSFMRGVPLYGVLLALEAAGRVVVGVAHFPALGDTVYAAAGHGCRWNGRRCRVRDTARLDEAVVSFTDAASFAAHGRADAWARLQAASYYRVGWSDAYGHALVATGRLELMLDPVVNPWDCAPFGVIVPEAGGFFGSWAGEPGIYAGEAISTTRRLLPEVLRLVAGAEGAVPGSAGESAG